MSKISPALRHKVAMRDGLAYKLFGPVGFTWFYRCAVCRKLIPDAWATGGHIIAACMGGSKNPENLRLECNDCNQADARKYREPPTNFSPEGFESREKRKMQRQMKRLSKMIHPDEVPLFDNVPVWFEGTRISFTSRKRAEDFLKRGQAILTEDGIELKHLKKPIEKLEQRSLFYIPNNCCRCGSFGPLQKFWIYPNWHPYHDLPRFPSQYQRPLCKDCVPICNLIYTVEIDRVAHVVTQYWIEKMDALVATRAAIHQKCWRDETVTNEVKQEFLKEAGKISIEYRLAERQARKEIGRIVADSGLYFPSIFNKACIDDVKEIDIERSSLCRSEVISEIFNDRILCDEIHQE